MSDFDPLVSAALDAQVPFRPDRRPAWDDVLARAGVARVTGPRRLTATWLPRWQWRRVILAFALVVVGVVVTGSALATLGVHPLGGLSAPAGHRPGSLDTSFGRGGMVMAPPVTFGAVAALAIQQDGKLVAAGEALVRYHANGSLDTSFGRGGIVTTPGSGPAAALAIQQDGKLVAAGSSALVRYNANGTLDRSFGRGGKVTTPGTALAIQKDGKLVAAGSSNGGFALVRYHANGSLDGSFGRGGKTTPPVAGVANALAIQKNGELVAAGGSGSDLDFALVRYNANGSLDTSFGRGGKVTTPIGGSNGAHASALAIQKDGKLLVAGSGGGGGFALARYNANGSLDTSFGRGGIVTTPGSGPAAALAIQKDGKLVAAASSNGGFALVRYNANGSLDTSFGSGGKVTTPGAGGEAIALAIQKDGKLVTAGGGSHGGFALVRYNANGTLDGSFGRVGIVTTPTGDASALAIQKGGKLVAAGSSNGDFALVRYHANGTLDGSFGGSGKVTTPISTGDVVFSADGNSGVLDVDVAYALAIQQDGKLVAAGQAGAGSSMFGPLLGDFALVRYNANGTLDTSFGRGGIVTTPIASDESGARALAIQQDGKLVAAGWSLGDSGFGSALVRYHANGTLDRSFGRGGKVTTPIGGDAFAIQKDGKLVAVGESDNGFALVRYHANGTLDTSFGRGGKVATPIGPNADARALAIQQDGKLVVAGSINNRFALVRYNANGTLDTSFGRGGKVTTPTGAYVGVNALAIQKDGKLVATGSNNSSTVEENDFVLVRYNANGTLDRSFGRGGKVTTPLGGGDSALAIQQDGKLVTAGSGYQLVRYWP
jgi:uncharacterized delta-60 repeat protein